MHSHLAFRHYALPKVPSAKPTDPPTKTPSSKPSSRPSSTPSGAPSSPPSNDPSSIPSSAPSEAPSSQPSSKPSSQPSLMPSGSLSSEPSSAPSESPSSLSSTIPSSSPSVTKCFPNARRVKLEAVAGKRLQLHVVQVFSSLVDGDIANGKPAAQSSTRMPRTVAAAAIDGDKVSFSRTNDDNAWWHVDLEESYPIKAVYIGNHYCKHSPDPTECLCHLTGVNIILLDDANATVTNQVLGDTCGSPRQVVEFERKFECVQSAVLFDEL
jgi:hypothetical protein